jgi:hypothetical protein
MVSDSNREQKNNRPYGGLLFIKTVAGDPLLQHIFIQNMCNSESPMIYQVA